MHANRVQSTAHDGGEAGGTCYCEHTDSLAPSSHYIGLAALHLSHAFDFRRATNCTEHWDSMLPVLLHLHHRVDSIELADTRPFVAAVSVLAL